MLSELKNIKSGKRSLREFGLTIGTILVILGGVAVWRGKAIYPYFLGSGLILIVLGVVFPGILKPLQKAWMGFSIIVGFFMSRLILIILFYCVLTPMGVAAKAFGKDILDEKIDKSKASYWKMRDGSQRAKEDYEKQF